MTKKLLFLLLTIGLAGLSFGQNQTNKVVGNRTFISSDKNLNDLATAVNQANEIRLTETGSRNSAIESQQNYEAALTNYLHALEEMLPAADKAISEDLNAEITLVKELLMQLQAPKNR